MSIRMHDVEREAAARGVLVKNCGNNHIQLIGYYLVNFYPRAKKGPSVYVAGMSRGRKFKGDARALVDLAFNPPSQDGGLERKRRYGNHKARLLESNRTCHWCGKILTAGSARLDHKIPLSKGGSHGYDNLVLACSECDMKKGNLMPHEVKDKQGPEIVSVSPDAPAVPCSPLTGPVRVPAGEEPPAMPDEPSAEAPTWEAVKLSDSRFNGTGARKATTFTIVGYWLENDLPFVYHQTAFCWEDAVHLARLRVGDIDHDQLVVVEVLAMGEDGVMIGQTGMQHCVRGPVGNKLLSNHVMEELSRVMGELGDSVVDPECLLADFIAETCDRVISRDALRAELRAFLSDLVGSIREV